MKLEVTQEGFSVIVASGDVSIAKALSVLRDANQMFVGGHNDWVLPDSLTLLALLHASTELRNGRLFWSSSKTPKVNGFVGLYVSSASLFVGGFDDTGKAAAMLVRREQIENIASAGRAASLTDAGIE